jgi:uncharacterized membrane protein
MSIDKFPFGASVKFGWQKTKENLWRVLAVVLIWIVISVMFSYYVKYFEKSMPLVSFLVQICYSLVNMILTMGIIGIGLKIYAGEKFEVIEMFETHKVFLEYILGTVLYFLAVLAGLILLIVPGIILIIRMGLYSYLIVDKKMGAVDALKESMRLTKGNTWNLFLFWFVLVGVLLLGLLALFVGVLVACPVTLLAYVFVYRYLEQKKAGVIV